MAKQKTCFVIMPFGKKPDTDKKELDFNKIYTHIFKSAIEDLGLRCIRCDEIEKAGSIHGDMFEHILDSDVALADITTLNANVFYELGVRHTLKNSVTVLVRRKGTKSPFNIQGFRVINYDPDNSKGMMETQRTIKNFIENGLESNKTDSPVHKALNVKIGTVPKPIKKCEVFEYQIRATPKKRIGLITGDIQNIEGIDVWVNSENTNMQMARFFDRSISSVIRYLGAKRHPTGHVVEDTVADELSKIMDHYTHVPPTTIIVTGAGELETSHKVKKIFHAASVEGMPGQGYGPIRNIEACITRAFQKADTKEFSSLKLRSMLFPIIGTGTGMGELPETAEKLIKAAIAYLETYPTSTIERAYFLTWSEKELEVCQSILYRSSGVTRVRPRASKSRVKIAKSSGSGRRMAGNKNRKSRAKRN